MTDRKIEAAKAAASAARAGLRLHVSTVAMQRLQPPLLCNCTSAVAAIQIPKEGLSTYKDQLLLAALIAVCMVAKLPIAKFQIDEPWRARDFEINKHENKYYLLDSNKSVEISSALITKFAVLKSGSNLYGFMH